MFADKNIITITKKKKKDDQLSSTGIEPVTGGMMLILQSDALPTELQ